MLFISYWTLLLLKSNPFPYFFSQCTGDIIEVNSFIMVSYATDRSSHPYRRSWTLSKLKERSELRSVIQVIISVSLIKFQTYLVLFPKQGMFLGFSYYLYFTDMPIKFDCSLQFPPAQQWKLSKGHIKKLGIWLCFVLLSFSS